MKNDKIQILSIDLSSEELDELRTVLEFAGMIALDLATNQVTKPSENQLRALKHIAASSAVLLNSISESMQNALTRGDFAETILH